MVQESYIIVKLLANECNKNNLAVTQGYKMLKKNNFEKKMINLLDLYRHKNVLWKKKNKTKLDFHIK